MGIGRTNASDTKPGTYYPDSFQVWINNMDGSRDLPCATINATYTISSGAWSAISDVFLSDIVSSVLIVTPIDTNYRIDVWSEKNQDKITAPVTVIETSDSKILSVTLSKDYIYFDDLDGWGITFTPVEI